MLQQFVALSRAINTCSHASQVLKYYTFIGLRSMAMTPPESTLLGDDTEKLHDIKLVKKIPVNHDTRLFRFALPSPNQHLGICVGQHVGLSGPVNGEDVLHWYTPLSCDTEEDRGSLELLIKIYFPCPEFPKGGRLTQYLEHMNEGDTIKLRGPRGKIRYLGRGRFVIHDKESGEVRDFTVNKINMVAGGSGLAPMLQLLRAKARDPDCPVKTSLLFANLSEEDIMMRDELELLKERGTLNKVWYTVDNPPSSGWKYDVGYITDTMLRDNLFAPSEDTLTLMCGRKAMTRGLVQPLLERIGHQESRICKY